MIDLSMVSGFLSLNSVADTFLSIGMYRSLQSGKILELNSQRKIEYGFARWLRGLKKEGRPSKVGAFCEVV
jgi:hypothetical protein